MNQSLIYLVEQENKTMKHIISSVLMSLLCVGLYAQTLTVKDAQTDQTVPLVTLYSKMLNVSAVTDANGQVELSIFKDATDIELRLLGFEKEIRSYSQLMEEGLVLYLDQSSISLSQVVISGSRWSQTSRDVPSKIKVISAKDIALQNPQTAADLLASSGEVFIQKSQQGGGSPMIRGFSTNRLLLTVDGVRMNTAIFRSGNVQNVISLDPFATESAEVLFGPGSVIYGSDAIGGVMSFKTLTPTFSSNKQLVVAGEGSMRYSSANQERTGHFHVNMGWDKWALVTSFSTFNYDDLRMGRHGPSDYLMPYRVQRIDSVDRVFENADPLIQTPSAYSQINMMQKVRFRPSKKWDLTYAFHYSETSSYGRFDRHQRTRNGLPRYAEWDYGPQTWMMNQLTVEHQGDNVMYDDLTIRLAQQGFDESRIDRSLNRSDRTINTERVQAYSANIDFLKKIGRNNKLFYGTEAVTNQVSSFGKIENVNTGVHTDGPTRYPQSDWTSLAGYLTMQSDWTSKFSTQIGMRYNQFMLNSDFDTTFYPFPFTAAKINDGALTGSIGAIYTPTEKWNITLNLSTGFRSPNVDDVGKVFDSEPGSVVIPNPELSSEYVYNAELDLARVFGDFLKVDVTGYYTLLQNAMVRRDFTLNGQDSIVYSGEMSKVQAVQNAANATVIGVQAGAELRLGRGFSLSAQANYQKGVEEQDDGTTIASRHAAPFFTVARLKYNAGKLSAQFYGIYNAEVSNDNLPISEQSKTEIYAADANGNSYSPEWYTLNFKAMYQVTEHIAVSGGVENITDQRYRPYSSGLSGAGRNVILSAKVLF